MAINGINFGFIITPKYKPVFQPSTWLFYTVKSVNDRFGSQRKLQFSSFKLLSYFETAYPYYCLATTSSNKFAQQSRRVVNFPMINLTKLMPITKYNQQLGSMIGNEISTNYFSRTSSVLTNNLV